MSELVTIALRRPPEASGMLARLRHLLRSSWSGAFTLKDPALNRLYGVGARSAAGPLVDEHTMFACSALYDAVNQIASDVAKLPLNLKKRRPGGGSDDYVDSKLYKLLKDSPNPETRSMVFRRTLTTHALIGKGGFAEIERDGVGRPVALWIIEPHRVEPFYDAGRPGESRRKVLRYKIDGGPVILEARDMLHLQGLGWSSVVGMEMVQVAREAIGLSLASQSFAAAFFGNGTRFGGVLSSDQDLDETQKLEIRETIEAMHAKADKAFRLLVLGAGFKFQETGVKPSDAQMKELRDQQVQEIARFFGIPLHKLKVALPGVMSYASVEMADLDYYKGCILSWITLWEQELNAKLISPLEQNSQFFKHNVNAFLRADSKARAEFYAAMLDRGVYNADMVLDLEDLNPQPGGQGQMFLVQGAMVPKDLLAPQIQATIAASQPPAPPEPSGTPPDEEAQRALTEALARAEAADAAAREARALAEAETLARVALEATGSATAEELGVRRESEARAIADAARHELVADEARADVGRLTTERDAAQAALAAVEAALAEAQRTAAADHEAAAADRDKARHAEDTLARLSAERDAALAAQVEHAAAVQRLTDHAADLDATCTALHQQIAVIQETSAADLSGLQAALAAIERERDTLQATAATLAQERAALAATLETQREAERARLVRLCVANRGRFAAVLGRMARRECQQARAKQATPAKLRAWLHGYPALNERYHIDDLRDAVTMHLELVGSSEDPASVTATLVREHLAAFAAALEAPLQSSPEDFHAVLDQVLSSWETDRPAQMADAYLTEEMRHVA